MSTSNNKNKKNLSSFQEEDLIHKQVGLIQLLKKIKFLLKPHIKSFLFLSLLIVIYVISGRLLPLIFGYAIDDGIKKGNLSVVTNAAIVYFFLELLIVTLHFSQNYGIQKLGNKILYHLREVTITHIQALPLSYFDKNPAGRTVTRMTNDMSAIGELFNLGITAILINTLEMIGIVIAMFYISIPLTLVTLITAPFLFYICKKLSNKIRYVFKNAKSQLATINAFTAESLNGIKILQLFHKISYRQAEFERYSHNYKKLNLKTVKLFALLWPTIEIFNLTTLTSALCVGGLYQSELHLSTGSLTAFLIMSQSFFSPLRVILERYTQFQNSLASADRIFALLDEPEEHQQTPLLCSPNAFSAISTSSPSSLPLFQNFNEKINIINFRSINHRYQENGPLALNNFNLEIKYGESLALVGRTGSGKTTLISLLQRLYSPSSGQILINNLPLETFSLKSWREKVGVVLQDNFIFKGTIASNINLNNPKITRSQVEWAAELSGCQKIINQRAKGLDATVEELGSNLSAGEKQLISFARVLAFDPEILILDEATANIDSISESLIQEAVLTLVRSRTSIIIAHRLSTILHCDRIAVLNEGQLSEIGSHEELMSLNGLYYGLVTSQFNAITHHPKSPSPSCFSS